MVGATTVYWLFDGQRAHAAAQRQREESIARGTQLFGQYCAQCHGPVGEGIIGPPLNRPTFREGDPEQLASAADVIRKAVSRGRPGTTIPSFMVRADGALISRTAMPAWLVDEGGALTAQQIDDLVNFIQHGRWEDVLAYTGAPDLAGIFIRPTTLPPDIAAKGEMLLRSKGCLSCHLIGNAGGRVGPDLTYIGRRRDADYLRTWLKAPVDVKGRGPTVWSSDAEIPMNPAWMPTIPMTDEEREILVTFLAALK